MNDPKDEDTGKGLVDVTVVMAREMLAYEDAHPDEGLEDKREAAAILIRNGLTEAEARLLFGLPDDTVLDDLTAVGPGGSTEGGNRT